MRISFLFLGTCLWLLGSSAVADVHDPLDPFAADQSQSSAQDSDKDKSADELIDEAMVLFQDERPLDARTKLLKALARSPEDYRAHLLLSGYYMEEVGHFRLALKYVLQAQKLFEAKNGKPPYSDFMAQTQHDQILYLLAQARLNLDDYQGSLEVLDQYSRLGYYRDWYPGTRAWVLMKLGRVNEAIKVARMGILSGAEPGRTLNMLGILLSMSDQREDSLKVFKQAVEYELSLGRTGRPATPLNNAGEVYEEIFNEDQAESSWLKSTRLPDGCEHVLPSLNLTMLYLDQGNLLRAKQTIDAFESCVAQYPLRNGEEHRALVHFARGRIALQAGAIDQAVDHFEEALQKQQWFGKIGTSEEDLRAAALISLSQALRAKNNIIATTLFEHTSDWLSAIKDRAANKFRAWWLMRRARQILVENLSNFEDLYVRHTDSMLDYASLGDVARALPRKAFEKRTQIETAHDKRPASKPFYEIYRAANLLEHGDSQAGAGLVRQALSEARDRYDDALRAQALLLELGLARPNSAQYQDIAIEIFKLSRAALRSHGFKLPINFSPPGYPEVEKALADSAFAVDNNRSLPFLVSARIENGATVLRFTSSVPGFGEISVTAAKIEDAVNSFAQQVFSVQLQ
ncbi:MAG: hypothetical protein K1X83_01275 [Oligoflexia bacterium]|nr:hypothetical protein [Oligoflexia bacterium]